MPAYSTLRDFVDAITTGETNITKRLTALSNSESKRRDHRDKMAQPGLLNGTRFPGWLRGELLQGRLSEQELQHIERWPDPQKEIARTEVYAAWTESRPIYFSWELYPGDEPITEVRRDPNDDVRLVFKSPRKGVHLNSWLNMGDISVDM
jgi:hypothetical protein